MLPSTLLIDLDGVLRLWPKDYTALEQAHDLPPGSIGRAAFDPPLLELVTTGRITDKQWREEVKRRLSVAFPDSKAQEGVAAWSLPVGLVHEDVLRLVIRARGQCRVGLVTNATDRLHQDLASLGLAQHLDFVVNSSAVGVTKPSRDIFLRALEMAGTKAHEAVFVDDTLSNVLAANALGIQSHHFMSIAGLEEFMQSLGLGTNAA